MDDRIKKSLISALEAFVETLDGADSSDDETDRDNAPDGDGDDLADEVVDVGGNESKLVVLLWQTSTIRWRLA